MTNKEIKAYKGNPAGTIFGLMEHKRLKKCEVVNGGNRMTNKEAIEQFKKRLAITFYRKQIPEYYEAIEMAVDALEKADKYRCSECGFTTGFTDGHTAQYKYCPQCGRRISWEVTE